MLMRIVTSLFVHSMRAWRFTTRKTFTLHVTGLWEKTVKHVWHISIEASKPPSQAEEMLLSKSPHVFWDYFKQLPPYAGL